MQDANLRNVPLPDLPDISGLLRSETVGEEEALRRMREGTKQTYTHEEINGRHVPLTIEIAAPFETVFDYCANVYSLTEWTYSVRDLQHVGGGLYRGTEKIQPDTSIYIRCDSLKGEGHGLVVYPCAWDQGLDLWMRYYLIIVDRGLGMNDPGTIIHWVNFQHPNYLRDSEAPTYINKGRDRTDRMWVGDIWPVFREAHLMEATNLKLILEDRLGVGTGMST